MGALEGAGFWFTKVMWEVRGGVGSGEAVAVVLPNVMGPEVGTILAIVMGT